MADYDERYVSMLEMKCAQLESLYRGAQAQIDRLMMEFCPDEMTDEQRTNWAAHQKPVSDAKPSSCHTDWGNVVQP